MIFTNLAHFFLSLIDSLLAPLDAIADIHLNIYFAETVIDCFLVAGYIIPVVQLLPIVSMMFFILGWRIIITILKTLWDILPIV